MRIPTGRPTAARSCSLRIARRIGADGFTQSVPDATSTRAAAVRSPTATGTIRRRAGPPDGTQHRVHLRPHRHLRPVRIDARGNGSGSRSSPAARSIPTGCRMTRSRVFAGFRKAASASTATISAGYGARHRIALGDDATDRCASHRGWDWPEHRSPATRSRGRTAYKRWTRVSLDFAGGDAVFAPGLGTAQGAQFLLSDMLGNHILFLGISAVQAMIFPIWSTTSAAICST